MTILDPPSDDRNEEHSPPNGVPYEPNPEREIPALADSGCEAGPATDDEPLSMEFPGASYVVHTAISIELARMLLAVGWYRVAFDRAGVPHRIRGFTGSMKDSGATMVAAQFGLRDKESGAMFRSHLMICYVMPGVGGGCHLTIGNSDMMTADYGMSKFAHKYSVNTTDGRRRRIEVSKMVPTGRGNTRKWEARSMKLSATNEVGQQTVGNYVTMQKGEAVKCDVKLPFKPDSKAFVALADSAKRFRVYADNKRLPGIIVVKAPAERMATFIVEATGDRRIPVINGRAVIPFLVAKVGAKRDEDAAEVVGEVRLSDKIEVEDEPQYEAGDMTTEEMVKKYEEIKEKWSIPELETTQNEETNNEELECATFNRAAVCETGNEAQDESALKEMDREQEQWYAKRKSAPQGSAEWKFKVAHKIASEWPVEDTREVDKELAKRAGVDDATADEIEEAIELIIASIVLGLKGDEAFADNGHDLRMIEGVELGIDLLDLSKPMGRPQKRKSVSKFEGKALGLLAERFCKQGIWEKYDPKKHGFIYLISIAGRADRHPTILGRIYVSNLCVNDISRIVACPALLQEDVLGHLLRGKIAFYISNDVLTAFPRLRICPKMRQFLAVSCGTEIFVPMGGPLGWTVLPGAWTLAVGNEFTNDRIKKGTAEKLTRKAIGLIRRGCDNPLRGILKVIAQAKERGEK